MVGKRDFIEIYGNDYPTPDGSCVRDYIHVADLAATHFDALNYLQGHSNSHRVNCGYNRGYSVKEVIVAIEKVVGSTLNVEVSGRRQDDAPCAIANNEKLLQLLDWKPNYTIHDIIESTIAWEKKLTFCGF